jgi:recombination protein RecA
MSTVATASEDDNEDDKKKKGKKPTSATASAREKILKAELEQIKKITGVNDIRLASQYEAVKDLISTGNAELDRIITPGIYDTTGAGGVPRGFVCEFFGPYAGGKSSLCLMLAAHVTAQKLRVLWCDPEGSYVPEWGETHGVNNEYVSYMPAGHTGEEYLEAVQKAAASGLYVLVVIDSLVGLVPKQILETPLEDNARIAAVASMMSRAMPKLVPAAKKGNCTIAFINQIRFKMGVMYGNPETTPGGEALKFFASLRLRLSQIGAKKTRGIMRGDEEIGIRSNVQVVKSRFGPPFKETVLPIYYSNIKPLPIDRLLDLSLSNKVVRCKTNREGNEPVQHFTLPGFPALTGIAGIDEFKNALDNKSMEEIAKQLVEKKVVLEPDVVEYLKSMADDPTNNAG